jgi:hypothetical protein
MEQCDTLLNKFGYVWGGEWKKQHQASVAYMLQGLS